MRYLVLFVTAFVFVAVPAEAQQTEETRALAGVTLIVSGAIAPFAMHAANEVQQGRAMRECWNNQCDFPSQWWTKGRNQAAVGVALASVGAALLFVGDRAPFRLSVDRRGFSASKSFGW